MSFLVFALVAIAIIAFVVAAASASNNALLPGKFAALGVLKGMTEASIVAKVGPPNSRSAIGLNQQVLQWMSPGYHIALVFTDGICDGVTHEHSA